MQTSKERMIRAIESRNPDKVPVWINFDRDPNNYAIIKDIIKEHESDLIVVGVTLQDFVPIGEGYHWLGYKMETFGETMGEILEPPLEDWNEFGKWKKSLPDFSKEICYEQA